MPEGSTLADYAQALAAQVDARRPHVLVGVSMGGMVAQELAAITKPQQVIIISSWKGPQEMPPHLKLLRGTHPERLLSKAFLQRTLPIVRWQMGVETPETQQLFDQFLSASTIDQLKVQINACLNWNGPSQPLRALAHIHGDQDRLMPIASAKGAQVVKGGGHFMIMDQAPAITRMLDALCQEREGQQGPGEDTPVTC
jgi:pimeloyl-ACP methyl ester carboxylesterase